MFNQPPPLADYDAFGTDETLKAIAHTFGADKWRARLHEAGRTVGSARVQELARQANRSLPELRTHDRFGQRVDRIDFHPAWHELMRLAIGQETHALCWNDPAPGAQVARAALSYIWNQGENGICCPIGMTYSAIPVLRRDPERWEEWGKLVTSKHYELAASRRRGQDRRHRRHGDDRETGRLGPSPDADPRPRQRRRFVVDRRP